MSSERIITLAGELARLLLSVPETSHQLHDLASVLRILKDSIHHNHVAADLFMLACDVEDLAQEIAEEEL